VVPKFVELSLGGERSVHMRYDDNYGDVYWDDYSDWEDYVDRY